MTQIAKQMENIITQNTEFESVTSEMGNIVIIQHQPVTGGGIGVADGRVSDANDTAVYDIYKSDVIFEF